MKNTDVLLLRDWDRARCCEFNPTDGTLRWLSRGDREGTCGFLKTFLLGGPLLVYLQENVWYLREPRGSALALIGEKKIAITHRPIWGPLSRLTIETEIGRITRVELRLLDALAQKIDATWDALDDSSTDFSNWLRWRAQGSVPEKSGASR